MSRQHREVIVDLLVGPEEDGDVELLGLFDVHVVPESENCIDFELLSHLDDLHGIVFRLGDQVGHRVEYASALRVSIFDETVKESSFRLLRVVGEQEDLDHLNFV